MGRQEGLCICKILEELEVGLGLDCWSRGHRERGDMALFWVNCLCLVLLCFAGYWGCRYRVLKLLDYYRTTLTMQESRSAKKEEEHGNTSFHNPS